MPLPMPRMFQYVVAGTEAQFISKATVRKTGQRMISEHLCMPATQLLGDKYLSLTDDNHLQCVTSEHTRGQLGRKQKTVFLFVYPFRGKSIEDTLSPK